MDTFVAKMDFPDFFLVFPWNAWLALLKNCLEDMGSMDHLIGIFTDDSSIVFEN